MYSQNNDSHPDRFAGQYPPPPPLKEAVAEHPPTTTAVSDGQIDRNQQQEHQLPAHFSQSQSIGMGQYQPYTNPTTDFSNNNITHMHSMNNYTVTDSYNNLHNNIMSNPINYSHNNLTDHNSYPSYMNYAAASTPSIQQQQQALLPQPHAEVCNPLAPPPPILNDYHSPQSQQYYHSPAAQQQRPHQATFYQSNTSSNTANEDVNDTSSLDSYLRREREEYLKHEQPTTYSKPTHTAAIKMASYEEVPLPTKEEEKRPMVKAQYARPTPPPENEAESYRYRPVEPKQHRSCCRALCCCYNPAITCCSFFWLLVSIAFLAAGVALMIASKVVTDKCNNQCLGTQIAASLEQQVQSACGTLCSKVLHDGMFYGGIVVAGLAALAILWKIIMWTCAGYSK